MLRIGFVTQTGSSLGGAEHSLLLLLRHLPRDVEPRLILFEDGDFAMHLRAAGYPVEIVPMPAALMKVTRERPRLERIADVPAAVWKVAALLRRRGYDVVHTNSIKAHFLAGPAASLARVPVVMHFRDILSGIGRTSLRFFGARYSREQIACSTAVSRCYGLTTTSVIVNPIDVQAYDTLPERVEARAALGLPSDAPIIGIVGRINRWKGHDRFLRIAARANAVVPLRCAIIGEPRFRDADFVPELHRLAKELGIADRTIFLPWQSDPRIVYRAIDVHCNCSLQEPFGRTTAEAGAAGTPTVTFDDGGATDIIRDGFDGRIIPAGDEGAFAAAVIAYVQDREACRRAGEAARREMRRFDAAVHAERVVEILRRSAA
jgi:glycosyltransferase involved in cell wall biosynthesis